MGLPLIADFAPLLGLNFFLDPSNWPTILMAAFGLGTVIFVHELGHFAVAKWCGVKCEKFFLGFDIYGLKLLSFRRGETEYGIGILPLGGYVKMLGQDDNPSHARIEMERSRLESIPGGAPAPEPVAGEAAMYDPRSYMAQSVPKRMAIISAGVIMNVIFAFVFATIAYSIGVRYLPSHVSELIPGGVSWTNDLRVGDEIVRIDSVEKPRFDVDIRSRTALADLDRGYELEIKRPGVEGTIEKTIKPTKAPGDKLPTIGIMIYPASTLVGLNEEHPADNPAARAKPALKHGDKIVAINDQPVESFYQIDALLAEHPEQPLKLSIERKDEDDDKKEAEKITTTLDPEPRKTLGLVMKLGPILSVQQNSPAAEAGVRVGDRLLKVDGADPGDPLTLAERLRVRAGQPIKLTLARGASQEPVEITVTARPVTWTESPLSPKSLASVPALGIAYEVSNFVSEVEPDSPAADTTLAGKEIVSAKFNYPKDQLERAKELGMPKIANFVDDDAKGRVDWPHFMEVLQGTLDGTEIVLVTSDNKEVILKPAASKEFFMPDHGLHFQSQFEIRRAESFGEALALGLRETKEDVLMVYRFLQKLWTGQVDFTMMRGPGTIAYVANSAASAGLPQLLIFLAMLSANLAVINFLPIPILDGGHMVFLALEGIRGKPVSEKVVIAFHYVGFCFIISLMVFVISMDVKDFAGW